MEGFIKLPRNIFQTEIWKKQNLFNVYVYFLYNARFQPTVIGGVRVEKNELLTTIGEIAENLELSKFAIRNAIDNFKAMGAIKTLKISNSGILITLLPAFLSGDLDFGKKKKTESKSDKNSEKIAAFENIENNKKNEKNEKNDTPVESVPFCETLKEEQKSEDFSVGATYEKTEIFVPGHKAENDADTSEFYGKYGEFRNVKLTWEQYKQLCASIEKTANYIEKLSAYLHNNPHKSYDSHYAVIRQWYFADENKYKTEKEKNAALEKYAPKRAVPDPTASYDILRAEERARRSVPILKKRERR